VIATEPGEQAASPRRLPKGDWVLFALAHSGAAARWEDADIVAQSLGSGERRVLMKAGGSDARYVPTGHLVYAQGPFSTRSRSTWTGLAVTGTAVPVVQGVRRGSNPSAGAGDANYGVSTNGTLRSSRARPRATSCPRWRGWISTGRGGAGFAARKHEHPRFRRTGNGSRERRTVLRRHLALRAIGHDGRASSDRGREQSRPVWSRDGAYLVFQSDARAIAACFASAGRRLELPQSG
jgi:hypothetical protein